MKNLVTCLYARVLVCTKPSQLDAGNSSCYLNMKCTIGRFRIRVGSVLFSAYMAQYYIHYRTVRFK